MTDRYAVFGNPVGHSKSPAIHARFAAQTGQDLSYEAIAAPLDGFGGAVAAFRAAGARGANVTVPFKEQAFALADVLSERAQQAGAVNTLRFDHDGIFGDNTDGSGLLRDLECNLGIALAGRRVLLLGAGGAARGTMHPLLAAHPALLVIANRTADKAAALAASARRDGVAGLGLDGIATLPPFDVVINATSAGLHGEAPSLPAATLAAGALAYDMLYGRETPFMAWARHAGARVADGLGMLVEQAADAFALWRGVRPETAPVIAALRQA